MLCIRVSAKTSADDFRTVSVALDGSAISCDCEGFSGGFCSNIDAVLVAGERAMVHVEDLDFADQAMALVAGRIAIPETWRGSWRRELKWRGLSREGSRSRQYERADGRPRVCFTGAMVGTREEMKAQARENGWETVGAVSKLTDVLVAADPTANSSKLVKARANGTAIVTPEEWKLLMTDGVLPS